MGVYSRIRDLREDSDLTQKQTAEKLFMHLTQYRRYECGESELPFHIAINIAQLYQVSLDYLAGFTNCRDVVGKSALTETEIELLKKFRLLDASAQGRIMERVEMLQEKEQ